MGLYKIVIFIYKNLNTIKANLQLAVQKRNCKLQKEIQLEIEKNFFIFIYKVRFQADP